jgi:hypothetical protein
MTRISRSVSKRFFKMKRDDTGGGGGGDGDGGREGEGNHAPTADDCKQRG